MEIKRVIIKNTDDEKYLVVVRENVIERYTNEEEIQSKFDEVVEELLLAHDIDAENFTELFRRGIIKSFGDDDDLLKEVVYYTDDSKLIARFQSGNEVEILGEEDDFEERYEEAIRLLCEQYGVTEEELEELRLLKEKEPKKSFSEVLKEFKIKNFIFNKGTLAVVLAGTMALMVHGAYKKGQKDATVPNQMQEEYSDETENLLGAIDNFEDYNGELEATPTPEVVVTPTPTPVPTATPTPEVVVTATPSPTPTPEVVVTPSPTPEVIDASEVYQEPTSNDEKIKVYGQDERVVSIYVDQDTVDPYIKEGEFNDVDSLLGKTNEGMQNLANHFQNPDMPLNDYVELTYCEKYFENPIDRAFIEYYSHIIREISYSAFIDGDLELAKEYIDFINYDTIRCIRDGGAIQAEIKAEITGQMLDITFDDLSPEAKEVVLNLAAYVYYPLSNPFQYGAEELNKQEFFEILQNAHDSLENTNTK